MFMIMNRMKKYVGCLMIVGMLGLAASCADNEGYENTQARNISFVIEDFIPEESTKTAFHIATMSFRWAEDDVIGIFPESGWQTEFPIQGGAGSNIAVFDGGNWGLRQNATYYGYYPFDRENFESKEKREAVRYSYEGQEVCFLDSEGLVNLSGYDFMASGASMNENGMVNFSFRHLGALCRVRFKAPETANYSKIIIEAGSSVFPISGYYDATDKDGDGKIAFVSDNVKTNRFEMAFPTGCESFDAGEKVELYFLMPPVDLSSSSLKLRLSTSSGKNFEYDIEGKNVSAGRSYGWEVDMEEDEPGKDPIFLGPETANCYIISEAGYYMFPAVKGNSSVSVGTVSSAEILWESFGTDMAPNKGDLIASVSYSDGAVLFSTADNFREGNALIAVKDKNGNILWSWHIWLTDKPEGQVYRNNAGTMMDRNLGATSTAPGDVAALGLMYQWGRKDPFLGSSSTVSSTIANSTLSEWPSVTSSESTGTIEYAISNPTTFIIYNRNNEDWYYSNDSSADTRWQSIKTIYDPCPAGYRVPDGSDNGVWAKAFGGYSSFYEEFDTVNNGFDFGSGATSKSLTEEKNCWYPAAGYKGLWSNPILNVVGTNGSYWSCTFYRYYQRFCAYYFYLKDSGTTVSPKNFSSCYSGHSVRCFKED